MVPIDIYDTPYKPRPCIGRVQKSTRPSCNTATGVFAHRGVRVVHRFVVLSAAEAGADFVAAHRRLALAILTFLLVGLIDQSVPIGTAVGVAVHRV